MSKLVSGREVLRDNAESCSILVARKKEACALAALTGCRQTKRLDLLLSR